MPQQANSGWTPVDETAAPNGWTPIDEQSQDQGGPTARFLTRFTGLPVHDIAEHPGAYLNPFSKQYWDKGEEEQAAAKAAPPPTAKDFIPGRQTYQDIKDKNYAGAAGDVAGVAAQVAPILFGGSKEIAPGETPPLGPKAVVTAPVRMAARTAEAALNSKLASGMKAMTPADEAAASPFKVPGRDFGLPKRGSIAQAFDPASSPSRTMPGQNSREVIAPDQVTPPANLRPDQLRLPEQTPSTIEGAVKSPARSIGGEKTINQRPQPAKPIPPRSGLALPARPVGSELQDLPATSAKPAAQTGEALGTIRSSSAMQTPKPIQRGSLSQLLQQQLNEGLGAAPPPNPKAPIYQRGQLSSAMQEGSDVPQGHTAVEGSSAIRSKMYDPAAREFHARLTSGDTTYVYGDVSPEEASGFEGAKSKGQAFQAMKANHPLVAKIVNGKRMPIRAGQPSR